MQCVSKTGLLYFNSPFGLFFYFHYGCIKLELFMYSFIIYYNHFKLEHQEWKYSFKDLANDYGFNDFKNLYY